MIHEWNHIEHLLYFFKPFAEITVSMSGQKYPTISRVIVLFNAIMGHLEGYMNRECELQTPPPEIIITAAEAAYEKIREYYNKTSVLHCIVTLLDPRFNLRHFKEVEEFTPTQMDYFLPR